MSLISGLERLIGIGGKKKPQQKPQPQPQQQGGFNNVGPMQKINLTEGGSITNQLVPGINAYQGNQDRLNAQKALGFTPTFTQNLINAAPITGKPLETAALNNKNGAAAEFTGPLRPNQIVLNPKAQAPPYFDSGGGESPDTLLHEGLHRVYANNPGVQQQFIKNFNASATPALKNYVLNRLTPYAGATKGLDEGGVPVPNYNPNDLSTLPQNLQNEAHSFVSEYPTSMGLQLPGSLQKYYSQYYNPRKAAANTNRAFSKLMVRSNVNRELTGNYPGPMTGDN